MKSIVSKFKKYSSLVLQRSHVAFDLGTMMTRVAIDGKGIVLREPTFVGHNTRTNETIFFGSEAKDIFGKAPNYIEVIKPIEHSIISDFDATELLVREFLRKSVHPFYQKSLIKRGLQGYSTVPTSSTEVEQKALEEALIKAGFHSVKIIEKPIVAAYGAGMNVFSNTPVFVIDLGAGIIEMAIVIMGGIVASKVIKAGGDYMDKLIHNYLHLKYGVVIGEQTSEQLKNKLFNLKDKNDILPIRGKSLENGLPKSVRVTSTDIGEALAVAMNQIVDGIKELIESIPPEIIDGLIKNGIVLTGNLAHVEGIDKYISNDVKIPVIVADNPEDATIHGLQKLMNKEDLLKRVVINM